MDPIIKQSRKFQGFDYYTQSSDLTTYHLLPFRFHRIHNSKEVLVNEVGDFLLVPTGTAEKIIARSLQEGEDDELYADLIANFFISEQPIPPLLDVIATRYRTKKAFLDNF